MKRFLGGALIGIVAVVMIPYVLVRQLAMLGLDATPPDSVPCGVEPLDVPGGKP